MDARKHFPGNCAPIVEIAAINIAWVCGLSGFTSGLMTCASFTSQGKSPTPSSGWTTPAGGNW
jgi:hypothetical protein